ncbi:MAG: hypothetical protein JXB50_09500, partial [Spirochaetes bacterium]|nr:hypothetical protein [Spirochaetota bacterium]
LLKAFTDDFNTNGPSLARITRTSLKGWQKHKNHPDKRIVKRFKTEINGLSTVYAAAVWAMIRYFEKNKYMKNHLNKLLNDLYTEFGWKTRIIAPVLGLFIKYTIIKEEKRLSLGWTYEPSVIYEKNARALELEKRNPLFSKIKIPKINIPVYDYKQTIARCRENLENAQNLVMEKINNAQEQLQLIYNKSFNKSLQYAYNDTEDHNYKSVRTNENALNNISQIKNNMDAMIKNVKINLKKLSDNMVEKYDNIKKQIKRNSREIYKNIKLSIKETLRKCNKIEKDINLSE